ncbi:MAG TPA: hypothetical protein IAC82_04975 [Candidatus Merdivicinus intestinigallinarum]|nr:hypothetical protein [Candidatus Merdivicinus intestinigallinarum]
MSMSRLQKLVIAALLCAIGILIPVISPIKITLDPMSFTLGSHVAIFVAMFVSPAVALCVELGTTVGFVLAGFPPAVVLRALVQVFFVVIGAYWLQKKPDTLNHWGSMSLFVLATGLLHGAAEALISTWFYFGGSIDQSKGFFETIILLVGVGTLAHHIVDFVISYIIWRPVCRIIKIPTSVHFRKEQK